MVGMIKKIALLAPASPLKSESIVIRAKEQIEAAAKVSVVYENDCYEDLPASARAKIVLQHCLDPDVDLLWAVRGGEGSAEVIPFLHNQYNDLIVASKKTWLGFSDITAILFYFSMHLNWPVIHGPCVNGWLKGDLDAETMGQVDCLLTSNLQSPLSHIANGKIVLNNLLPLNNAAVSLPSLSAPIIAGNLSLINVSLKEIWECDAKGKIIVLEDVNEKPHAVRRMLNHLYRVGVLSNAVAIVMGEFIYSARSDGADDAMSAILRDFALMCSCPVFASANVGHGGSNVMISFNHDAIINSQRQRENLVIL